MGFRQSRPLKCCLGTWNGLGEGALCDSKQLQAHRCLEISSLLPGDVGIVATYSLLGNVLFKIGSGEETALSSFLILAITFFPHLRKSPGPGSATLPAVPETCAPQGFSAEARDSGGPERSVTHRLWEPVAPSLDRCTADFTKDSSVGLFESVSSNPC